jgi:hypothetical protein
MANYTDSGLWRVNGPLTVLTEHNFGPTSNVPIRCGRSCTHSLPRVGAAGGPTAPLTERTCGYCIRLSDRFLRTPDRTGHYPTVMRTTPRLFTMRSVLFSEKNDGERVEKQRLMRFARQHVKPPKYSHQLWSVLDLAFGQRHGCSGTSGNSRSESFPGG